MWYKAKTVGLQGSAMQDRCEVVQGVSAKSQFWGKRVWVILWLFYGVKGKYRQVKYEWQTRKRV